VVFRCAGGGNLLIGGTPPCGGARGRTRPACARKSRPQAAL